MLLNVTSSEDVPGLDNVCHSGWSQVSCGICCLLTMFCSGGGREGVFLPLMASPGGMRVSGPRTVPGSGIWRRVARPGGE